jgi:hypothetical protein
MAEPSTTALSALVKGSPVSRLRSAREAHSSSTASFVSRSPSGTTTRGRPTRRQYSPLWSDFKERGAVDRFVHRHCDGYREFESYAKGRSPDLTTRSFGTVYFAFHGSREGLGVGEEILFLDRLADPVGQLLEASSTSAAAPYCREIRKPSSASLVRRAPRCCPGTSVTSSGSILSSWTYLGWAMWPPTRASVTPSASFASDTDP